MKTNRTAVTRRRLLQSAAAVIALMVATSGFAEAQTMWSVSRDRGCIDLEVLRPSFATGPAYSISSFVFVVLAEAAPSQRLSLVAEMPYATVSGRARDYYGVAVGRTESGFGNPFAGVRIYPKCSRLNFVELGVRFPLASDRIDDIAAVAQLADAGRLGSFNSELLIAHVAIAFGKQSKEGAMIQGRLAPTLVVPGPYAGSPQIALQYGGKFGLNTGRFHMAAGVSGLLCLAGEGADLAERTTNLFALEVGVRTGAVEPHLMLRVPLDREGSAGGYRHTLSLGFTYPFK